MAVYLRQNPTSPNAAYTKLLYVVKGSTSVNQPQHKFVCKVSDTQGNFTYLKQTANASQSAVFDVSIPVRGWLKPDNIFDDYGKAFAYTASVDDSDFNSYDRITVAFGEEYGTSLSSSVTLYDGKGAAGQPAVSASENGVIQVFRGTVVDPMGGPFNRGWYHPTYESTGSDNPVTSSLSGSFNLYMYETGNSPSSSFADTNLLVSSSVTESRLESTNLSSSMPFTTADPLIHVEVYSLALSSSDYTYQLSIQDLTTNQTIYSVSGVTGSAGPGTKVLISHDFTASADHLYGVNAGGAFTGSWVIPTISPSYSASDNQYYGQANYPLFPGQYIVSASDSATGIEIIENNNVFLGTPNSIFESFPSSASFVAMQPGNIGPPNANGKTIVQSWNFNMSSIIHDWSDDLTLSNYPQAYGNGVEPGSVGSLVVTNSEKAKKAFRSIANGDLAWISFFNYSGSVNVNNSGGSVDIRLYNEPNAGSVDGVTFYTGSSAGDSFQAPPLMAKSGSNSSDVPLCIFPVGPANLRTLSGQSNYGNVDWNYMNVFIRGQAINHDTGAVSNRGITKGYYRDEPCNGETRFNFVFINDYGMWDNLAFNTPAVNRNTSVTNRKEFTNSETNYGGDSSIYDVYARGIEQFYLSSEDEFEINTPPIIDNSYTGPDGTFSRANMYQELMTSPNVYLQQGDELVPIVITDKQFRYKTNQRSQKFFSVKIKFKYSNKRRSRT